MAAVGVIALGRPTFDVPFADEMATRALAVLDQLGVDIVGRREVLYDADAAVAALDELAAASFGPLLVLQVTFTDAAMLARIVERLDKAPLIWGFPEPRTGGRLRLNALCGINLAAHALGKRGIGCGYLFADPAAAGTADAVAALLAAGVPDAVTPAAADVPNLPATARAQELAKRLRQVRIGVFGEHPDGFDTCAYDEATLSATLGPQVETVALTDTFATARAADDDAVAAARARAVDDLGNLDGLEAEPVDKSLRLYTALRQISDDKGFDSIAVRCWPETFTEYGCAACGAMAMLNEDKRPAACEADVYGSLSTLILQELAQAPALLCDLVDIDTASDTGVFWHCGLAPVSMADPDVAPQGTIHSNRRKPLLNEFPLRPGRITVARVSQAKGAQRLVIGGAEVLAAPMSFSGTSGVVKFDRPAGEVFDTVVDEGLEHHFAFTYGDHRAALREVAAVLRLPVVELA